MEDIQAWIETCLRGAALDDVAVDTLERRIVHEPDDIRTRAQLVVHYWRLQLNRSGYAQLTEHSVWFIEHRPDLDLYPCMIDERYPEGYERARRAWLAAVDRFPERWSVLLNASNFFAVEDTDLAINLLRRCVALHRDVSQWHERLAFLLMLGSDHNEAGFVERARDAASELAIAINLTANESQRTYLQIDLANAHLVAGDLERAREAAQMLLESDGADVSAGVVAERNHQGNIVLGRVAMAEGNVVEAKARLHEAAIRPGRLRHKPDAKLAQELIRRGEHAAAIEYLDATRRLGWSVAELSAWVAQKQGAWSARTASAEVVRNRS